MTCVYFDKFNSYSFFQNKKKKIRITQQVHRQYYKSA